MIKLESPYKLNNIISINTEITQLLQNQNNNQNYISNLINVIQYQQLTAEYSTQKMNIIQNYLLNNIQKLTQQNNNSIVSDIFQYNYDFLLINIKQIVLTKLYENNADELFIRNNNLNNLVQLSQIDIHSSNLNNGDLSNYNTQGNNTVESFNIFNFSNITNVYNRTANKFVNINGTRYTITNHKYNILQLATYQMDRNPYLYYSTIDFSKGNKVRIYLFDSLNYTPNNYLFFIRKSKIGNIHDSIVEDGYKDIDNTLTNFTNQKCQFNYTVDQIQISGQPNHLLRVFTLDYKQSIDDTYNNEPVYYTLKIYTNIYENDSGNNPTKTHNIKLALIEMA